MTDKCPRCGGVRFAGTQLFVSADLLAIPTRRCSRKTCGVHLWRGIVVAEKRGGPPSPEVMIARRMALYVQAEKMRQQAKRLLEEADEIDRYIKEKAPVTNKEQDP